MSEAVTVTVEPGDAETEAATTAEESAAEAVATAAEAVAVAAETAMEAAEAIAEAENGDDEQWLAVFLGRLESLEAQHTQMLEMLRLGSERMAEMQGSMIATLEILSTLKAPSQVTAEAVETVAEAVEANPAASAGDPLAAAGRRKAVLF